MTLQKRFPALGSSVDPEKLSLTIKSLGVALIPLVIAIARGFDFDIAENELVQVINSVATIVSLVGVIWGVTRKWSVKR